jgi:hypothetical protein
MVYLPQHEVAMAKKKKIERKKVKDLQKGKGSKEKPEQEVTPEELDKVAGGHPGDPFYPAR